MSHFYGQNGAAQLLTPWDGVKLSALVCQCMKVRLQFGSKQIWKSVDMKEQGEKTEVCSSQRQDRLFFCHIKEKRKMQVKLKHNLIGIPSPVHIPLISMQNEFLPVLISLTSCLLAGKWQPPWNKLRDIHIHRKVETSRGIS